MSISDQYQVRIDPTEASQDKPVGPDASETLITLCAHTAKCSYTSNFNNTSERSLFF